MPETPIELPVQQYLDAHNIPYRKASFPTTTEKGAANVAQALGYRERQMIKTLIFTVIDTGEHTLIMVGGDQSAKSGLLKKALGSRNITMVASEAVFALTGYMIGSIPPFGWQPPGFRSFLEQSLMEEIELGVGTGQWGQEIFISPARLVRASGAHVVTLVEMPSP